MLVQPPGAARQQPSHLTTRLPPPLPAGESTAGMMQSSSYTLSGEPSPISRGAGGGDPRAHSAHSSPLRLQADLAAVQSSLANMALQVSEPPWLPDC
jgi:hypothetical protein